MKHFLISLLFVFWTCKTGLADPALGQFNSATGTAATITTAGVTTSASGSTFYIVCMADTGITFNLASDNKGNTYSQIGTTFTNNTTGVRYARFYKTNGSGGSGHTGSCNLSGSSLQTVFFTELIGVDTTDSLDVSGTPVIDASNPFQSNSTGTLAHANEIILSFAEDDSTNVGDTWTASGGTPGFTLIADSITDGSSLITAAMSYEVVSVTTAQQATWSSVQGTSFGIGIDSFFGTGGGGGSSNKPAILLQQVTP